MYNLLKQIEYPTLRLPLCICYPSHINGTSNNNEILVPFSTAETIRKSFKYQCVKVWLEVPELMKYQQTYL